MQERLLHTFIVVAATVSLIVGPYALGRVVLYIRGKDHTVAPRYVCWVFGVCLSVTFLSASALLILWVNWVIYGN